MKDRELLEMAARAAGYKVRWHEHWNCHVHVEPNNIDNPPTPAGRRQVWVPLVDDGDALRLLHAIYRKSEPDHWIRVYDNLWGGSLSDMRRAIVRAAAEIGRAMG